MLQYQNYKVINDFFISLTSELISIITRAKEEVSMYHIWEYRHSWRAASDLWSA
jgi:hypothetical protein